MNFQYSIYIPRMSTCHNAASVYHYMSHISVLDFGDIDRIDFTPINKKPGFGEDVDSVVKSAFIHFSNPRMEVGTEGEKFWRKILSVESYKIQVSQNEYWICLKNKNPIKHTMMNIHQVAENGRYLENLVQEQAEEIKILERKLEGLNQVVYQLIGGLYNQSEQSSIIKKHLEILLCDETHTPYYGDESKWGIYPTTRQGDECERRIEELEKICARLDTNLHDEDQDSQLLRRKYHKVEIDDYSTINSELMGENIIEMEDYETPDYRWRHQK